MEINKYKTRGQWKSEILQSFYFSELSLLFLTLSARISLSAFSLYLYFYPDSPCRADFSV